MPHTDKQEKAKLYDEALAFNAPLKVCQFGKQEGIFGTENSFVSIEGDNLILSSVAKSDDDTVLIRVYNPTDEQINGKITLGFDAKSARSIRLDGKVNKDLEVKDNTVSVKVGKGKIYTVEIL